ncbi:hypothetical protein BKK54_06495 [Rodentibacter genomosp. 1]|uniref:Uncharacterized protein n=1 Tax=Rodentibacter genomosp. 1 TaxID=1908264 RepID=A0A1V3J5K8_9PAST|nr:hypothetical protein [Rodentibacter genomosp. 1]OOF50292.1 hypothetical protein BKK54_06495 [Rodentibacter genomosp. 1]
MKTELTIDDLEVGRVYSAKRPKEYGFPPLLGDRQIKWIGTGYDEKGELTIFVRYDSPSVRNGRNYPKITAQKFLKWAKEDVTELMPKSRWRWARQEGRENG